MPYNSRYANAVHTRKVNACVVRSADQRDLPQAERAVARWRRRHSVQSNMGRNLQMRLAVFHHYCQPSSYARPGRVIVHLEQVVRTNPLLAALIQ